MKCNSVGVASMVLAMTAGSVQAGGVFITGHDPDYHALRGANAAGARQIIQRGIDYVTGGKPAPRILLVTDLRNPGGDQSDSRLGLVAAGYSMFDVADYGSGTAGVLDLHTVTFANYDVLVVASDYGGWLRQDELDILNSRSGDIISYLNNNNGGLVAFAEAGNREAGPGIYTGTTHDRFGYLPFIVSQLSINQGETGFTVTAAGAALGLTMADVNGNASHNVFTGTGGLDVIDNDPAGNVVTLATRNFITPCGVNASAADLLPYRSGGHRYQVLGAAVPPPAGWAQPAFNDSTWATGAAAFGIPGGCPLDGTIQTPWPPATDLFTRRVVVVPPGATSLRLLVAVDNDVVELFFNGTSVGGNFIHENCAEIDRATFPIPPGLVQTGPNLVACHLRDRGGASYFDVRLVACVPVNPLRCPNNVVTQNDPGRCAATVSYPAPTVAGMMAVCTPPAGTAFPTGTTTVTCADPIPGQANLCAFTVTVVDREAPSVTCRPGANPAGRNIPGGDISLPGGWNPDGFFQLQAEDNCDAAPRIYVRDSASPFIAGPFPTGATVKITQAPGAPPSAKPMGGVVVAHIKLNGDPLFFAADAEGNVSATVQCQIPPRGR